MAQIVDSNFEIGVSAALTRNLNFIIFISRPRLEKGVNIQSLWLIESANSRAAIFSNKTKPKKKTFEENEKAVVAVVVVFRIERICHRFRFSTGVQSKSSGSSASIRASFD